MFGLYDDNWSPRMGGLYHVLMFTMTLILFIIAMWMLIVPMFKSQSGFESDELGGLSSGASLRFAAAQDQGPPGSLVTYSTTQDSFAAGFGGPEPPVFYDIGDVNATHDLQQQVMNQYVPESFAPTYKSNFAPTYKSNFAPTFKSGLKPDRWMSGFTDSGLLARSAGK